jgi:hypothetical protein
MGFLMECQNTIKNLKINKYANICYNLVIDWYWRELYEETNFIYCNTLL